jgi:serine/threonine protein kinase
MLILVCFWHLNQDNADIQLASHLHIDPTKLELRSIIARGAFSFVWEAEYFGESVAVKQLVNTSHEDPKTLLSEVALCSQLRQDFIMSIRGVCLDQSALDARGSSLGICLVMQLAGHGSILAALDKPAVKAQFESWNMRLTFLSEVATGMHYLHSRVPPILHRDIKPGNVLVTHDLHPLIADFGLACRLGEDDARSGEGTQNYMAPELFFGERPSCSSDVYSFGLLMWFVATCSEAPCSEPWAGKTRVQIQDLVEKGFRPLWPEVLVADSSLWRFQQV